MMRIIRGVAAVLMLTYLALLFTIGTFMVAPLYVTLRLVSEARYLRIVCWMQMSLLFQIVFFMEAVLNLRLRVTGEMPPREAALVISNHLTQDWVCMYPLAFRLGTLGYVRTVIKRIVGYFPGFGWGMTICYWPFVSRDFGKDESYLRKLFRSYKDSSLPVQLWIYPEGTRLTKSKLRSSQEYAREKGYPIWNHVMLPKYRGFSLAVNSLNGVVAAVHDVTLSYEGWKGVPGLWELMTASPSKRHVLHVHINRLPLSSIPNDEEGKKRFLMDCFSRKEELLQHFATHSSFPGKVVCDAKPSMMGIVPHIVAWAILFTAIVLRFVA